MRLQPASSVLAPVALTGLAMCVLGLAACGRLGFGERALPAADGGAVAPLDAAPTPTPDAGTATTETDASAAPDAGAAFDASTMFDAAMLPDAAPDAGAQAPPDATADPDAASTTDASEPPDATAAPDANTPQDAAVSCTPSATRDYCASLPSLANPPRIDGTLDCGPPLIDLPPLGWHSSQTLPSDNHARYAAAWRPDGLYVYVEVDDPLRLPALASHVDPWCGDGIEIYADNDGAYTSAPDYDNPGTIQLLATAPARDSSTALAVDARYHTRSLLRVGDWAATRHVAVPRDSGYALEAFVAAADLGLSSWTLAAGARVGLDIAINVSVASETQKVDCGYYLGQYYLRLSRLPCTTDSCRPYSNVAAFCTPTLE